MGRSSEAEQPREAPEEAGGGGEDGQPRAHRSPSQPCLPRDAPGNSSGLGDFHCRASHNHGYHRMGFPGSPFSTWGWGTPTAAPAGPGQGWSCHRGSQANSVALVWSLKDVHICCCAQREFRDVGEGIWGTHKPSGQEPGSGRAEARARAWLASAWTGSW